MRRLKIFVPDICFNIERKYCSPFLYPFLTNNFSETQRIEKYGEWVTMIDIIDSLNECDIVVPAYNVNYYFNNKKNKSLVSINQKAIAEKKITVCWTAGDWGITPDLMKFHLYRFGGYFSKNGGNNFSMPYFFDPNPVKHFYNRVLSVYTKKTRQPILGFCGRASNNIAYSLIDIGKNFRRGILKSVNLWHEDLDWFFGSSYKRYRMLKKIQHSNKVKTNFIFLNDFGGTKKNTTAAKEFFYQNIQQSQYIFCYRGWGNYSIRLYETMAAGRIPLIITSDNNLPFADKIDWDIFPVFKDSQINDLADLLAEYHSKLSAEMFIGLQYKARCIWEEYLTYKGFMKQLVYKYLP